MSSSYLLELDRWNVKNNGTDALKTSNGINNALAWASSQGFTEVTLPNGIYLIDETNSIQPQSNMTLNLGGATLRIRNNGLSKYAIISFVNNQQYSRITNGKIEGDRYSHDYSSGGSHEGGYGIQLGSTTIQNNEGNNTRYITIDNLEIFNCTGDAIIANSTFGQIAPIPSNLAVSWESGGISTTNGNLIDDKNKIRSKLQIDLKQPLIVRYGYFGLYGNGYGNLGTGIMTDFYDAIFYKKDGSLLFSQTQVQFFDEIEVPKEADYAKVVLHQNTVPTSSNSLINIRVPTFSQFTFIEKCNLHHCRRQGITVGGAKRIYIRNNRIHHIAGTDPQAGIDIEDGYDLNQFIYISQNDFHDNQFYNVVVVNGKSIFIEGNRFTDTSSGASLTINAGTDKVSINNNIFHKAKVILAGDIILANNNLFGTQVSILGQYSNRPIKVNDNLFHNCKLVIDNPFPFLVTVDGCKFYNDSDKLNAFSNFKWTLELKNKPQILTNCIFDGQDILYLTYVTESTFNGGWIFENNIFQNVKNPTIVAGMYKNCTFNNIDLIGVYSKSSDTLELSNCKIYSKDLFNVLITIKNLKSLKIENCNIDKPNSTLVKVQGITEDVILRHNNFQVTNNTLNRPILILDSNISGNLIIIDNNIFTSKISNLTGILNSTTNIPLTLIRNNILQKSSIIGNGNEIMADNIIDGVLIP